MSCVSFQSGRLVALSVIVVLAMPGARASAQGGGCALPPPTGQEPSAQLPATTKFRVNTARIALPLRDVTESTWATVRASLLDGRTIVRMAPGEYTCVVAGPTSSIAVDTTLGRRGMLDEIRRHHGRLRVRVTLSLDTRTRVSRVITVTRV